MEQWIPLIRQCSITESMRLILSSRVKFDITKEEHLMKYVVLPCRDNESSNKSDLTNELTKIFKAERRSMTDQEKKNADKVYAEFNSMYKWRALD